MTKKKSTTTKKVTRPVVKQDTFGRTAHVTVTISEEKANDNIRTADEVTKAFSLKVSGVKHIFPVGVKVKVPYSIWLTMRDIGAV